jgi:hypothetical protein
MKDETRRLVEGAEGRVAKATRRPWVPTKRQQRISIDCPEPFEGVGETLSEEDADFICLARDDVPALCATVRELDEENERLTVLVEAWKEHERARVELEKIAQQRPSTNREVVYAPAFNRWSKARATLMMLGAFDPFHP